LQGWGERLIFGTVELSEVADCSLPPVRRAPLKVMRPRGLRFMGHGSLRLPIDAVKLDPFPQRAIVDEPASANLEAADLAGVDGIQHGRPPDPRHAAAGLHCHGDRLERPQILNAPGPIYIFNW
jgi:hypothetical protein